MAIKETVTNTVNPAVLPFVRRKKDASIIHVPVTVGKREYRVPTLIWDEDGYDDWVGDYARHLVIHKKQKPSSVEETVKNLRVVRRLQRRQSLPYEKVTDEFLLTLQGMFANAGVSSAQSDGYITSFHDFLKWAESKGRLRYHVQRAGMHEYPEDMANHQFPITSEERQVMGRRGHTYKKWMSPLLFREGHSSVGSRNTPTSDQIEQLQRQIELHPRNSARNLLLVSCAYMCGARVSEMVQLSESDFPTPDSVMRLFDEGMPPYFEVVVVRKNRGQTVLRMPLDLVLKIVDHIHNEKERREIIANRNMGDGKNDVPLFLSERGHVLATDSITRICGYFFKKAGIQKANVHRLRARYITEVIEYQLDLLADRGVSFDPTTNWQETVLTMAVQLMGHGSPISLQPYLNEILVRRATADGKIAPRSIEVREKALAEIIRGMANRFSSYSLLLEADKALAENRFDDVLEILEEATRNVRELKASAVCSEKQGDGR